MEYGLVAESSRHLSHSGKRRGRRWKFSLLVGLPSLFHRYAGFTRHANLAKTAAVTFIVIRFFDILTGSYQVLAAVFLVVAGSSKRPNRTAVNAFAAGSIHKERTPGTVVVIEPDRRLHLYLCNHRPGSHGLAFRGNQSVAKPKRTQARSMGCVPF